MFPCAPGGGRSLLTSAPWPPGRLDYGRKTPARIFCRLPSFLPSATPQPTSIYGLGHKTTAPILPTGWGTFSLDTRSKIPPSCASRLFARLGNLLDTKPPVKPFSHFHDLKGGSPVLTGSASKRGVPSPAGVSTRLARTEMLAVRGPPNDANASALY